MYSNRNRKQLKRKWSGKEISYEAVPKNSRRWSGGDVGRQIVPEAASSHRKRTIANSGQPCSSDHQLWRWRRRETAAVGIGDTLDVVGKIPWRQTMRSSVNEHSQVEIFDAFRRPQPVKVSQHRCDVLCRLSIVIDASDYQQSEASTWISLRRWLLNYQQFLWWSNMWRRMANFTHGRHA